jgi:hypothetical protein
MKNFFTKMDTLVFKNGVDLNRTMAVMATTKMEHFAALTDWLYEDFTEPLVLHFAQPWLQHLVNFNFNFPVDVILVNEDGSVGQIFTEPVNVSSGSYIRGFSSLKMVILCPEHFIAKNGILKTTTLVDLASSNKL